MWNRILPWVLFTFFMLLCLGVFITAINGSYLEAQVEKVALEEPLTSLEKRVEALEDKVRTLDKTIQAYHEGDQYRPPEDMSETWIILRRALSACGCEIHE